MTPSTSREGPGAPEEACAGGLCCGQKALAMHVDPYLFTPDAVDAATRAANEQLEKALAQAPPITSQQPAAIRAARASGQGTFGPIVRLPHAETRTIPGPAGEIPLRILRPRGAVRGVYLHLHGGGHALARGRKRGRARGLPRRRARLQLVPHPPRRVGQPPQPALRGGAARGGVARHVIRVGTSPEAGSPGRWR